MQHTQQQPGQEIHQLKANWTKEKGSQHNPENVAEKEETPEGGCAWNAEPRYVTMADVAALPEQEKAKMPKEKLFSRRPPHSMRLLNKPNAERYEPPTFSQDNGKKGRAIKHVSKFIDTQEPYVRDEDLCLRDFLKSLSDLAYTWYTGLKPGSIPTWDDMVEVFYSKYFHGEETVTLATFQNTK